MLQLHCLQLEEKGKQHEADTVDRQGQHTCVSAGCLLLKIPNTRHPPDLASACGMDGLVGKGDEEEEAAAVVAVEVV